MSPATSGSRDGRVGLRVADQETARVVSVLRDGTLDIVGAGCLVSCDLILTCLHVVKSALGSDASPLRQTLRVRLIGVVGQPIVEAVVEKISDGSDHAEDLAKLTIKPESLPRRLDVSTVEFASPLRHSGKSFSVLGFPYGNRQGRNARGVLFAADALGLVQMDGGSAFSAQEGFSGAPVWCAELGAFVGLVLEGIPLDRVAWCIPSQILCKFCPELPVRFRVPPSDRPRINDAEVDDPNLQLFGCCSDDGFRKLSARIKKYKNHDSYKVTVQYECLPKAPPARGAYVTFITYPDFVKEEQDAYELFAILDEEGRASVEFYPSDLFTVAAIGDGGDTALTIDLATVKNKPKSAK